MKDRRLNGQVIFEITKAGAGFCSDTVFVLLFVNVSEYELKSRALRGLVYLIRTSS